MIRICPACKHAHGDDLCFVELMVEELDGSGHPFHLQCWCDGESGPTVRWHSQEPRLMADVYRLVDPGYGRILGSLLT